MQKCNFELSTRFLDAHNKLESLMKNEVQGNDRLTFFELIDRYKLKNKIVRNYENKIKRIRKS